MREITLSKAVNEAIAEEMRRDETIFLLGEDVAEAGTPFKILSGLVEEFGTDRIVDTPIAEPGFMGIAVGAAISAFEHYYAKMTNGEGFRFPFVHEVIITKDESKGRSR